MISGTDVYCCCTLDSSRSCHPQHLQKLTLPRFLKHFEMLSFSIKDFFSKCDQICCFQQIWSHLLKKSLMEIFIFGAVIIP